MSDEVERLLGNGETVRVHRERASGGYIDDVPIEKILAAVNREIAKAQIEASWVWDCHDGPGNLACVHYGGQRECGPAYRERLEEAGDAKVP